MKAIYLLLLFCLSAPCLRAQDLLGIEGEEATSIGVYIKEIETGEVLYDYNSELALTPASVMKAITSASALSMLGEEFRFSTDVELRGAKDAAGVWRGDVVVRSSGDPTIDSENFKTGKNFCDSICRAIRRRGITSIDGRIIVAQTMKDAGPVTRWEIEDVAWPYGAGHFGFNYRDNVCTLYPLTGETRPHVPGLEVTVIGGAESNDLVRGVGSDKLTVYARNTTNKKWAISTTVPDPAAVFVDKLKKMLSAQGIKVSGKRGENTSAKSELIYCHRSPASLDILHSLMVRSDNLFAEGMLRALAPADTRDAAIKREKELWRSRGLDPACSIIFDGSGLTRGNRLQPRFLADVLEWMAASPMAQSYVSLFPKAGMDGTLSTFLANSPLKGKLALKTGSMNAVQCYAGYKLDDEGCPTHIVIVMVNGFFCKRAALKKSVEQLMIDTFL